MYFFTSDEHYGHKRIIEYCDRPFYLVDDMDETLIYNHNEVVSKKDTVIHAGDFTLRSEKEALKYISRLNGKHIFLRGSHDKWLNKNTPTRWEGGIEKHYIVIDHYAMRVWPRCHYGSWQLYGHSHGNLSPLMNQLDVGVDTNNFYPYSFDDIKKELTSSHKIMTFDKE